MTTDKSTGPAAAPTRPATARPLPRSAPRPNLTVDTGRLWQARHELGMTQKELADAINHVLRETGVKAFCTAELVHRWENGKQIPTREYQAAITELTRTPFFGFCKPGTATPPIISDALNYLTDQLFALASLAVRLAGDFRNTEP